MPKFKLSKEKLKNVVKSLKEFAASPKETKKLKLAGVNQFLKRIDDIIAKKEPLSREDKFSEYAAELNEHVEKTLKPRRLTTDMNTAVMAYSALLTAYNLEEQVDFKTSPKEAGLQLEQLDNTSDGAKLKIKSLAKIIRGKNSKKFKKAVEAAKTSLDAGNAKKIIAVDAAAAPQAAEGKKTPPPVPTAPHPPVPANRRKDTTPPATEGKKTPPPVPTNPKPDITERLAKLKKAPTPKALEAPAAPTAPTAPTAPPPPSAPEESANPRMNGDLMKQIQKGKKLKKVATNDRSAPKTDASAKPAASSEPTTPTAPTPSEDYSGSASGKSSGKLDTRSAPSYLDGIRNRKKPNLSSSTIEKNSQKLNNAEQRKRKRKRKRKKKQFRLKH